MKAFSMAARDVAGSVGLVICHNIADPSNPKRALLRKGHVITPEDRRDIESLGEQQIHVIQLDRDDVGEDEAGRRLASVAAGAGVEVSGESESEVRLVAVHRGLFRVNVDALMELNRHNEVMVWTLEDRVPVERGAHVASAKIAPLAIPRYRLLAAEDEARKVNVRVLPYKARKVGVLVREQLEGRPREKFEANIRTKLDWFGADFHPPVYSGGEVDSAQEDLRGLLDAGVELILVGGTGSTDPLDPTLAAITQEGGAIVRTGVPAHPGSTYWLATLRSVPIVGLASCGMFSKMTALDLILPRFFAGEPLDADLIAFLGAGGLISKAQAYRFPSYKVE